MSLRIIEIYRDGEEVFELSTERNQGDKITSLDLFTQGMETAASSSRHR